MGGPAPALSGAEWVAALCCCRHASPYERFRWPPLACRLRGFKNAKSAKDAKDANPRRLAPLALLGRTGGLIVVEAGGHTTGCGMGVPSPP